ncbi:hypothetical protein LMH87_009509 [Akanthomyces muscarius]|uniref:Uncharacterized protein n=1 Tax=Akanthomyces muscarius TaxID=2231603 RepID=A0A9W8ULY8_AKAMU|nr:hypothetical protein LMH87_009509 [Akanthomyces muscarius]KAJ4152995.1 hypothetical protein LMH87_009509 [Akanthomyces muscarius]
MHRRTLFCVDVGRMPSSDATQPRVQPPPTRRQTLSIAIVRTKWQSGRLLSRVSGPRYFSVILITTAFSSLAAEWRGGSRGYQLVRYELASVWLRIC